jgi:cell division protein FtsQ
MRSREIPLTSQATRVDAASVRAAVDGQIGTPLALVDFDTIKRSLARFPLIRSFVTETVPPDTLIIRIAERAPIATLATSSGFSVVDPAGVVILSGAERAPGLPLIELGSASKDSPAFTAAVGVLLALPADLLKRVDTVTAQTGDDVTLGLTGGTTVVWGSPEQSPLKARALAAAVGPRGVRGADARRLHQGLTRAVDFRPKSTALRDTRDDLSAASRCAP